MTSKNENEKEKISIISLDGLLTRPRSNTCPNFQLSTQSKKLKLGSKVVILGTDNVEQRVPQYVGVEGIIIDVPGLIFSLFLFFSSFFSSFLFLLLLIISSSCHLV